MGIIPDIKMLVYNIWNNNKEIEKRKKYGDGSKGCNQ